MFKLCMGYSNKFYTKQWNSKLCNKTELNPNTSESAVYRAGRYHIDHPAGYRYDVGADGTWINLRFSRHFILKVALTTVTAP